MSAHDRGGGAEEGRAKPFAAGGHRSVREGWMKHNDRTFSLARAPADRFDSRHMAASSPTGRDRLTLHVLQLGAIAVVLAALPYKAFDLDRYFVPKELVLLLCAAITAFVCVRNRNRITVTVVDVLLAAFLVSSVVSTLFAINL